MSPEARRKRAAERATRITRIEPGSNVPLPPKGLARIELTWLLSKAAWAMTGKPLPAIPRSELPIRRVPSFDEDGEDS